MREIPDLFYTEEKNAAQMLDLSLPAGEGFPVLVYFHGGGLTSGNRKDHRALAESVCACGVASALAGCNVTFPIFGKILPQPIDKAVKICYNR